MPNRSKAKSLGVHWSKYAFAHVSEDGPYSVDFTYGPEGSKAAQEFMKGLELIRAWLPPADRKELCAAIMREMWNTLWPKEVKEQKRRRARRATA